MSIVLSVCGVNFSLMMSDGRKLRLNDMKIVDEYYPKIKRINSKVIIGFTGDPIPTMNAIKDLSNYNVELLTLERIKRINNLGVKLIISGRNKSNKFVTYTIDSKDNFNDIPYFFNEGFAVNYALPHDSRTDVNQICDKYIVSTMPWQNIEDLKQNMRKCIREVSTICKSVNSNIFEEIIT